MVTLMMLLHFSLSLVDERRSYRLELASWSWSS